VLRLALRRFPLVLRLWRPSNLCIGATLGGYLETLCKVTRHAWWFCQITTWWSQKLSLPICCQQLCPEGSTRGRCGTLRKGCGAVLQVPLGAGSTLRGVLRAPGTASDAVPWHPGVRHHLPRSWRVTSASGMAGQSMTSQMRALLT
jgi:hypothetical protein